MRRGALCLLGLLLLVCIGITLGREPAKPTEREFHQHQFAGYIQELLWLSVYDSDDDGLIGSLDVNALDPNSLIDVNLPLGDGWLLGYDAPTETFEWFNPAVIEVNESDPIWVAWLAADTIDFNDANITTTGLLTAGSMLAGSDANYVNIGSTGDVSFAGSAGFYPRRIIQADIPVTGTDPNKVDVGEMLIWVDSDDGKIYFVYNDTDSGIKSVELP